MIDIGTTHFRIAVPSVARPDFKRYSTELFDEWERHISETLSLPDYSIELDVEEGSVKGRGAIAVMLGALYLGIGNYGDFISGLQTIGRQINSAGDFLAERATNRFATAEHTTNVRKSGGSLTRLQRLFVKVRNRELTVEQAMYEAQEFLGDEAASAPEFMQRLEVTLKEMPLHPEQLSLLMEMPELPTDVPASDNDQRSRPSRRLPIQSPPEKLRVEIRRESKKGEKEIRVIEL